MPHWFIATAYVYEYHYRCASPSHPCAVADHDNPDEAARKVFDKYDLDKNERLDRSEIRAWASPTRRETASQNTDKLMSETDTDRDGKLTKKEIFGKHKLWVNTLAGDEI